MANAIVRDCLFCGGPVQREKYNQYCSRPCYWAHRKALKASRCEICGVPFTGILFRTNAKGETRVVGAKTQTCSGPCNRKLISAEVSKLTGARKGNWKGGVSADHNHSFRGTNWPAIAERARKRDGGKCQHCGLTNEQHRDAYGKQLEVHHIEPFHNFTDFRKANRMANLVTLCVPCHRVADAAVPAVQMSLSLSKHQRGNRAGLARGEKHGQAKLTESEVMELRRRYAGGARVSQLAADSGRHYMTVRAAVKGQTWTHLPMR